MADFQQVLSELTENLKILQKREAKYGGSAPLDLLKQITDHEQAIAVTKQAISGDLSESEWRKVLKPPLVHIPRQPAAPGRDKNLIILICNVRKMWVEDYLNSPLLNAIYLDLGLQQKPDAVPQPFEELNVRLRQPEQAEQDLPPGTRAIDVYRQAGGRLLILGQPGSGKTTTLATLARDLLAEADSDPTALAPVILNLSSWAAHQKPLADWLAEELKRQYQVSRKLGQQWLAEGQLALLLDGLDEVAVDRREACVAAINAYCTEGAAGPLVVCSRLHDYETLPARLKLGQAVVLKKLTQAQVECYFERLQMQQPRPTGHLIGLGQRIWQDEALRELTETPLMLNIITLTYAHPQAAPLPQGQGDPLQSRIFEAYTERMFNRHRRARQKLFYSQAEMGRYLRYLAAQLQAHSLSQFSIGHIRGDWLPPGRFQGQYNCLKALIVVVMVGLIGLFLLPVAILIAFLFGIIFLQMHLFFLPFVGLLIGQIAALILWLRDNEPGETLGWAWQPALKAMGLIVLGGPLISGLCGLLFYGGLALEDMDDFALMTGLGLLFGLIVGLIVGLIIGPLVGLQGKSINHKVRPEQEIRRSWYSALSMGLFFGLPIGLGFGWGLDEGAGLIFGALFGFIGFLAYGGVFLIQHYLRLYLFSRHHLLPFKLILFLGQATELIFLQRLGGSYRFIHRSVQEHFAAQWEGAVKDED